MKKSIAKKLAVRVSATFALAFLLLLAGFAFSVNHGVELEANRYAKVLSSIYGDVTVYSADRQDRPMDLSFSDQFDYFGDYICTWYRVNHIFAYVPDVENGTITYLSVTRNEEIYGEASKDRMRGVVEKHTFTENELKVWKGQSVHAVEPSRFGKGNDVMMSVEDKSGNRVMVGVSVSINELREEMISVFLLVALFMLLIVVLLALLIHRFIRKKVSVPARHIAEIMSKYISDNCKSAVRLNTDNGDSEEFSMIAEAFDQMTEEIDNYIADLKRMGRERERQQAEIDIAARIQKGFLSPGEASLPDCGIKAVMKPARLVGGDLYDYLEVDKTHTMALVADVSGKGIYAAILMAVVLNNMRQFAKMGYSPSEILKNVNDTFSEKNPQQMFVTAFIGIYDSDKGVLTYANAGHNPPYLLHKGLVTLDGEAGTPLGLFPEETYTDTTVKMSQGDLLFLYTDGVSEAVNERGEFYGIRRLEQIIGEMAEKDDKHVVEEIEASVRRFTGNAEQNDDITMLSLLAREKPALELAYDIREFSKIRECLFSSHLPQQLIMDLCVAAEECFVNICSYAFDGSAPEGEKILFFLEYSDKVQMRFVDGGKQFDPRNGLPDADEYDIDTTVGGLGRLIAFTVADSVDYEYRDSRNILTITKSIN